MNLFEKLKQFKNITPNPDFTEKSRRAVLVSPQFEPVSPRGIFVKLFETAGSLALLGVLLFAIAGGFSIWKYFSPISFSSIDPTALHAEADAIDMQIELANLNYTENINSGTGSTVATPTMPKRLSLMVVSSSSLFATSSGTAGMATVMATATTNSSPASTSINEALQELTQ